MQAEDCSFIKKRLIAAKNFFKLELDSSFKLSPKVNPNNSQERQHEKRKI